MAAWSGRRGLAALSAAAFVLLSAVEATQDAVANGDTRTLEIYHTHTKESASITFRRDGRYDPDGLKQLNWILRDWRTDEPTRMDPRLFDIVWQVYREVGAGEPIQIVSAYRSPETNAALRRRSRAVAEQSQHMLGKAMDVHFPGVSMARVREVGMRLQAGGVGFYPGSNAFVHLDVGSVRHWPRMPRAQLARLFPDGRTVHMPREGKPLPGYEEAKAVILARGGSVPGSATLADAGEESAGGPRSIWGALFGGSRDEDSDLSRKTPAPDFGAPATRSGAAATSDAPPSGPGTAKAAEAAPAPPRRPGDRAPEQAAGAPTPPAMPEPTRVASAAPPAPTPNGEMSRVAPAPVAPSSPPAAGSSSAPPLSGFPSPPVAGTQDRDPVRLLFVAAATPTAPSRDAEIPTSRGRAQPLAGDASLYGPGASPLAPAAAPP